MGNFKVALTCFLLPNVCLASAVAPCLSLNQGCDCEDASRGFVKCIAVRTLPRNLPSNVTILDLNFNPIGSMLLAAQVENLSNLTVTQLFLGSCELRAIEDRAFMTQPSIRTLDLSKNNFKRLDGQIFFNLTNLKNLFLIKSSIHEITSLVFTYTPKLEYLDLGGNMLTKISNEFSSLSHLRTLLVSSNQIVKIADNAFKNQKQLMRLVLYGNRLTKPQKNLFGNLVESNGTLTLESEDELTHNNWTCCGWAAVDYKHFFEELPANLPSRPDYDILCSSPEDFAGKRISQIKSSAMERTPCNVTNGSTPKPTGRAEVFTFTELSSGEGSDNASTTHNGLAHTTGKILISTNTVPEISTGATRPPGNAFSNLTNLEMGSILIGIAVFVVFTTATAVRCYGFRSQKKAFAEDVRNLPNSIEIDAEEGTGVAYNAPVLASADNHENEPTSAGVDDNAYDTPKPMKRSIYPGSQRPSPSQRHKVLKRASPARSLDDPGDAYEQTQFNNSSSASYNYHENVGTASFWYESDESDDLWNINNVR